MPESESVTNAANPNQTPITPGGSSDHSQFHAAAFIVPLVVFLGIASCYPAFSDYVDDDPDQIMGLLTQRYVWMIAGQVVIATGLLVYFRKIYFHHFPLRFSPLSIVVGIVGVVLWIGLCELGLEQQLFNAIGFKSLAATRPAFNPFVSIGDAGLRTVFLILRFTLLAVLVPIVEELFLRGWLVRWIQDPDWEPVRLSHLSLLALLTPSIYGVLTHPAEALAAILWFGLVTILMWRTGNLWDCVVAHAVTNLLLGIYVVQFSAWQLW